MRGWPLATRHSAVRGQRLAHVAGPPLLLLKAAQQRRDSRLSRCCGPTPAPPKAPCACASGTWLRARPRTSILTCVCIKITNQVDRDAPPAGAPLPRAGHGGGSVPRAAAAHTTLHRPLEAATGAPWFVNRCQHVTASHFLNFYTKILPDAASSTQPPGLSDILPAGQKNPVPTLLSDFFPGWPCTPHGFTSDTLLPAAASASAALRYHGARTGCRDIN